MEIQPQDGQKDGQEKPQPGTSTASQQSLPATRRNNLGLRLQQSIRQRRSQWKEVSDHRKPASRLSQGGPSQERPSQGGPSQGGPSQGGPSQGPERQEPPAKQPQERPKGSKNQPWQVVTLAKATKLYSSPRQTRSGKARQPTAQARLTQQSGESGAPDAGSRAPAGGSGARPDAN